LLSALLSAPVVDHNDDIYNGYAHKSHHGVESSRDRDYNKVSEPKRDRVKRGEDYVRRPPEEACCSC